MAASAPITIVSISLGHSVDVFFVEFLPKSHIRQLCYGVFLSLKMHVNVEDWHGDVQFPNEKSTSVSKLH